MKNFSEIPDSNYIFGALLIVANKMDTLLQRVLSKHNVTAKQWFLLLVLFNVFEKPPTIKELASEMGSSHQNIKQVALKLQEKGMLVLEKDKRDLRATRIKATEKSYQFWADTKEDGEKFMSEFYKGIDEESFNISRAFIVKLLLNMNEMERKEDALYD